MKLMQASLLLCLVALSAATHKLFPDNTETVYKWHALTRTGTHSPTSAASAFLLEATLHVQTLPTHTNLRLSHLTHQLHNGELAHLKHMPVQTIETIGDIVKHMETPFRVSHNGEGLIDKMVTESTDPEFVRNIKKSIASIMQLNARAFEVKDMAHGFVSHEPSIYGDIDMDYTVVKQADGMEIKKMHQMKNASHLYEFYTSNKEPLPCDLPYEEVLMHDSQRNYVMSHTEMKNKKEKVLVPTQIEAIGAIFYTPHHAKSDPQYMMVNQTFRIEQVMMEMQPMEIKKEHAETHITFHMGDLVIGDFTHGRHTEQDMPKLINKAKLLIAQATAYLNEDQITATKPNAKQGLTISRLMEVLGYFEIEHFEELYKTVKDDEIFLNMLPTIGTEASTKFMRNLIVEDKIKEEHAIHMLEHLHENIFTPTMDLVKEMEVLMKLEKGKPSVKRVAKLCFGSLVHQSVMFHTKMEENKHMHGETARSMKEIEANFEKYMLEIIEHIKNDQDLKHRILHLRVLYNMKLSAIVEHLKPALAGAWGTDNSFRAQVLGPIAVSMQPEQAIEILWPILADRSEHRELRVISYFYIMESKPTLSQLTNIYWMMMAEPDEEVYNFHWTYVHTKMESKEPCNMHYRMRMRQLIRFMQPARHGSSSAMFNDYVDMKYGYSGGLNSFALTTNESQSLYFVKTMQMFNLLSQEYAVEMKVFGMERKVTDFSSLMVAILDPSLVNRKWFVDVSIMKQRSIINTFFINPDNIEDMLETDIKEFFKKEKSTIMRKRFHINFDTFHAVLLPNDLGMLAMYDYIAPQVSQDEIEMKKNAAAGITTVDVYGKSLNWMHTRHGLTFYNSITDHWQGIRRIQAFDSVHQVNVEAVFNPKQYSLKLSMKKNPDPKKNIIGVRAHIKQTVFIMNEDDKNDFVEVGRKEHDDLKREVVLMNTDDLNTGAKWRMSVFDTNSHITNGSMKHMMDMFALPMTKNFHSPISYYMLMSDNMMRAFQLMPTPGQHGLMMRIEPSDKLGVTDIDLTMRIGFDESMVTPSRRSLILGSPIKLNCRITYAIKNKEQSLKTWDITTNLDMNQGHTINSLKMFMTRMIPNQPDYKICVDGTKKWTGKGVSSHLNVAMSQSSDGKCSKDSTVIDVTMLGERSHEQNEKRVEYGACKYMTPFSIKRFESLHCLAARTSVRHYTYNIKTANMPTEFKKTVAMIWDQIKSNYLSRYTFEDEHTEDIGENNIKIEVLYPMEAQELDMKVITPKHVHKIEGIPTTNMRDLGVMPDNMMFTKAFLHLHDMQMMWHCKVGLKQVRFNDCELDEELSKDWVLVWGQEDLKNEGKFKEPMFVKRMEDGTMRMKMVHDEHTLEMGLVGGKIEMMMDGQKMQMHEFAFHDWMVAQMMNEDESRVGVMMTHADVQIDFDGIDAKLIMLEGRIFDADERKCMAPLHKA